ncbi:MAG: histidine kinase, partial [Candidatus Competibacteraceae bacterium]|nr:histidine kinase [Candidatus Competibacteraceae bacterium]
IMPYISIQLEAIALSFAVLRQYPAVNMVDPAETGVLWLDTSFYIALLLIVFAILFGTRHIDTTERHEGLVAAIAFESVVKLLAFLAVGLFISYSVYDGLGDIFSRAQELPELRRLLDFSAIPG